MIRPARAADLAALCALEDAAFTVSRLTRARFRHMLARANALLLVDEDRSGLLRGYALVLFRRGSRVARLYSITTAVAYRGRGEASALLDAVEDAAARRGADRMRLEVAEGNASARHLYEARDYAVRDRIDGYYEDGAAAVRYEKRLAP